MLRRLFAIAAGLSLLIALAASALWIRSYYKSDSVYTRRTFTGSGDKAYLNQHMIADSRGRVLYWILELQGPTASSYVKDLDKQNSQARITTHAASPQQVEPLSSNSPGGSNTSKRFAGFAVESTELYLPGMLGPGRQAPLITLHRYMFPIWPVVVLALVLPVKWLWRWRPRRPRARIGKCQHCGYDLRASTERCPECGMEIAAMMAIVTRV